MDAIKRLIVDWACHVRGYDALGAVANVTENGLEKHRAKGLECEAAWAAIEAAVVAETDALRAALAAARVELAEAYAFLQGFATASVGRECPPVTSTNIHRVADEVLGTMAKLRAEAAAEKQRADGLAAELDAQLTAGEALYKATVKLLAERDALKAQRDELQRQVDEAITFLSYHYSICEGSLYQRLRAFGKMQEDLALQIKDDGMAILSLEAERDALKAQRDDLWKAIRGVYEQTVCNPGSEWRFYTSLIGALSQRAIDQEIAAAEQGGA